MSDVLPVPQAAPSGRSGDHERREHDHRSDELLRAASRTSGSDRKRLIDEVVVDNLGLADALCRRYVSREVDAEELQQVARLGLVAAAHRFQPDRGVEFVAFAVPTILGELKRYFRDRTWSVRPPRRVQELRSAMATASAELCQTLGAVPTAADIAGHLGTSVDEVLEAERSGQCHTAMSLDQAAGDVDGDAPTLRERLGGPDGGYASTEAMVSLTTACHELSARDSHIVYRRFFCGWTQQEIGTEIGVTQMQVSRLLVRILRQLRRSVGEVDAG